MNGFHGPDPYVWPLTSLGVEMNFMDLFDELVETINEVNSRRGFDRILIIPKFKDIDIDRENRKLIARCQWASKQEVREYAG